MNNTAAISRRAFLRASAAAASAVAWSISGPKTAGATDTFAPPLVLFDKILNQLKLSLEDSAAFVAETGLDGVDCAVRPKDRIEPERVKDDLPRYHHLLEQRGRKLSLLTTAILNPESPCTRDILETARKLGVKYYRLGFVHLAKDRTPATQIAGLKPQLMEIAAMNRDLGLCALLQNHSPSGNTHYLGGNLSDMHELVQDIAPAQLGVAFDLGHALIVHGDDWKLHFEKLQPHIRVAYLKDAHRERHFVPFGEGEFGTTDYFTRLKRMRYSTPLSIHIEYDWARGRGETRETLAPAVRDSLATVRKWIAAA